MKASVLAEAVNGVLNEYLGYTEEVLQKAVKESVDVAVNQLRQNAPRKSGDYAEGFTAAYEDKHKHSFFGVAYNKEHYRLTHLLEYGHDVIRNGKKVGRARSFPHYDAATETAVRLYEAKLEEELKE